MELKERKEICILVIVRDEKILLETIQHVEGYEILSLPGVSINAVSQRIFEILGNKYVGTEKPFGSFTDLIIKHDSGVELVGRVFRIDVSKDDEIIIPKDFDWYAKDQIEADLRCKRDRRLYLRLFESRPLNLSYCEDQSGKWIDAKILSWDES